MEMLNRRSKHSILRYTTIAALYGRYGLCGGGGGGGGRNRALHNDVHAVSCTTRAAGGSTLSVAGRSAPDA
jgi:hypothetical protein